MKEKKTCKLISSFVKNKSFDVRSTEKSEMTEAEDNKPEIDLSESYFLCNVCYAAESDAVFMDCKHGGLCLECAYDVWNASGECYLCRERIEYIIKYDNEDKKGDMFKIVEVHQDK